MNHPTPKTLIYLEDAISQIRNHMRVNREKADRAYIARIREEDIELIKQTKPTFEPVCQEPTSEREGCDA